MAAFDPARHVAANLDVGNFSHARLAARVSHSGHMLRATAALLQQPTIVHADVARLLGEAVKRGVLVQPEAVKFHDLLPADTGQLRPVVQRMHQIATHTDAALQAEQGARLWGARPGASRARSAR